MWNMSALQDEKPIFIPILTCCPAGSHAGKTANGRKMPNEPTNEQTTELQ